MTKDSTPQPSSNVATESGRRGDSRQPAPGLYLTATPIGNTGDLTYRARDLLAAAAVIACEDTRVTGKRLARYGITTPIVAGQSRTIGELRRPPFFFRCSPRPSGRFYLPPRDRSMSKLPRPANSP